MSGPPAGNQKRRRASRMLSGSAAAPTAPRHSSTLTVRYSECDQQGVVYNAHYQAMCDAAMDLWMLERMGRRWCRENVDCDGGGGGVGRGFSMVVASEFKYLSSARFLDDLAISSSIARWGNTSFDAEYVGDVGGRRIFEGRMTYVCVGEGGRPTPIPEEFREGMTSSAPSSGERSRL